MPTFILFLFIDSSDTYSGPVSSRCLNQSEKQGASVDCFPHHCKSGTCTNHPWNICFILVYCWDQFLFCFDFVSEKRNNQKKIRNIIECWRKRLIFNQFALSWNCLQAWTGVFERSKNLVTSTFYDLDRKLTTRNVTKTAKAPTTAKIATTRIVPNRAIIIAKPRVMMPSQ